VDISEYHDLQYRLKQAEELLQRKAKLENILENIDKICTIEIVFSEKTISDRRAVFTKYQNDKELDEIKEELKEYFEKTLRKIEEEFKQL